MMTTRFDPRAWALASLVVVACTPPARRDLPDAGEQLPPASDAGTCPPESQQIYVVDVDHHLSRFLPQAASFEEIGTLDCPTPADPYSMAIDQLGAAWVLYDSGELFKVSLADAACATTAFQPNQPGFGKFGMGFASNTPGGSETLFIANDDRLGKISFPEFIVQQLGTIYGRPELTGTGSAQLWAFFPQIDGAAVNPRINQLDKATGNVLSVFTFPSLAGRAIAWAFAFWGGDFYIFLRRFDVDVSTVVYRVSATTGAIETVIPDTGRWIVGAGVSTCAPLVVI